MNLGEQLALAIMSMTFERRQGITVTLSAETLAGGIGFARIVPPAAGAATFRWAIDGEASIDAFIIGVWPYVPAGPDTGLIDIVAWDAADPRRFWTLLGHAYWLNEDAIAAARDSGQALALHPNPLDWLASGCRGAALLGLPAHETIRAALYGVPALHVESSAFAAWLHAELRRRAPEPKPPQIWITPQRELHHARA